MKNNRLLKITIIIAILLVGAYVAGSWLFSSVALDSPGKTLAETQAAQKSFAELGIPQPEEVTIPVGDITLSGFLFENDKDGQCGVILLHGYGGNRYESLQYAPLFWERGCDLLAYDHRGYGTSTPALHTYGYHEKDDVVAALDWFTARTGLDRSQVGLVGVSYGAATALQAAPAVPEVAFVLADSSYQDLRSILTRQASQQFGLLGRLLLPGAIQAADLRVGFDVDDVSPQNAAAQAAMPILLIHSLQDGFTPSTHSEAIYEHSNKDRTVLHINDWGSTHARDILTDYGRFRVEVDDFLDAYAPQFGLPVTP